MTGEYYLYPENIVNRSLAMQVSEFARRPHDFAFTTGDFAAIGPIPAEPAVLTGLVTASLEGTGDLKHIHHRAMVGKTAEIDATDVTTALMELYALHVGEVHDLRDLTVSKGVDMDELGVRAVDLTRAANLQTVAALALFTVVSTGEHRPVLVIPRKTFTEIPLENRARLMASEVGAQVDSDLPPMAVAAISGVIQNERSQAATVAFLAASLNLPRIAVLEQALQTYLHPIKKAPQPNQTSQPQGNRAARRAESHRRGKQQGHS